MSDTSNSRYMGVGPFRTIAEVAVMPTESPRPHPYQSRSNSACPKCGNHLSDSIWTHYAVKISWKLCTCVGWASEHFHCRCRMCGFKYAMKTADAK